MVRYLIVFIALSGWLQIYAQEKAFRNELLVLSENDNFDFGGTDRYYTNGFILQYNRVGGEKQTSKAIKRIHHWEAGIKIYNPIRNNRSLQVVTELMDRPYAGWSYLSYANTQIRAKDNVLQTGLTAGMLGPASQAQQLQEGWHKFWGIYRLYGWNLQVNNEIGLNLHADYFPKLKEATDLRFRMHGILQSTIGNTFTHAAVGMLFQTGKLQPTQHSAWWGAALSNAKQDASRVEHIFFAEPTLILQAYNATVQGGLFRKDKGSFTTPIRGVVAQLRTGMLLSGKRMSFRWYYTYRTREGARMRKGESWGSIALSYRF
ncbi:MAG: lipid A-modifier LpxR family protein [Chitinophagaceae bacterium]